MTFWTLKTSKQIDAEREDAARRQRARDESQTLDKVLSARRREVEEYEAKVQGFLDDLKDIFVRAGIPQYLTDEYRVKTKFDGLDTGERRLGMKWEYKPTGVDDPMVTTLGFVFVEQNDLNKPTVRIDFIGEVTPPKYSDDHKLKRKEVNDRYNPTFDDVYKYVDTYADKFQSTREFDNYDMFRRSSLVPPPWFVQMLRTHIPRI